MKTVNLSKLGLKKLKGAKKGISTAKSGKLKGAKTGELQGKMSTAELGTQKALTGAKLPKATKLKSSATNEYAERLKSKFNKIDSADTAEKVKSIDLKGLLKKKKKGY